MVESSPVTPDDPGSCCHPADPAGAASAAPAPDEPAGPHGYAPHKELLLKRLARIEGQVRGVSRMIEDDRYCIDVLTQIGAIETALEAVGMKVLEEHARHCVAGALASGDPDAARAKSEELLAAVQRFAKTR